LLEDVQSPAGQQTWCIARFAPRWHPRPEIKIPERRAIIIGAGLAGSAACERLAARGWNLTLIERHAHPAQEASGNLAGIYMPLLSRDDNPTARLTRCAYLFAARAWQRLGGIGHAFAGEACGVLQLGRDTAHAQALRETVQRGKYPHAFAHWIDQASATELLGQRVPTGGLFFPQAGWAHPAGVCHAFLSACAGHIEARFEVKVSQLQRIDNQWQVRDENDALIAQAPVVILANGIEARRFAQAQHLPLASVRGQVTYVAQESLPELPVVVCRDGYITRASHGMRSIGASYDMD
jgi:tRNA 5-methylaminomethyl-2-thiouridine biosynthesis bifunctional protein